MLENNFMHETKFYMLNYQEGKVSQHREMVWSGFSPLSYSQHTCVGGVYLCVCVVCACACVCVCGG